MAPCGSPETPHTHDINVNPPFRDPLKSVASCHYGVVKIQNIPFSVTTQEIKHFINRFSQGALVIPHVYGYPIHIIIERATGKTMDCYVEFMTPHDAAMCVGRFEAATARARYLKIGQRQVQLSLSSQGELMSVLFPRAKSVDWDHDTGFPCILPNTDPHSEGFRGFFTVEELASVVKHAETPQRSPFTSRCMQRTYESMISTLYKFPWLAADHYTVAARDYVFTTYMAQLETLIQKVHPGAKTLTQVYPNVVISAEREVGLSHSLLMDFLFAGLNTPTFSLRQKFHIAASCGKLGEGFPISKHAFAWPFACFLPQHEISDVDLGFWLKVLSDGVDILIFNGLSHGFEKYVDVLRDTYGYVMFRFTMAGNALHFKDGVAIEKCIIDQLIEKGRSKWCLDHGIPYTSLSILEAGHHDPSTAQTAMPPRNLDPRSDIRFPHSLTPAMMSDQTEDFPHDLSLLEDQVPFASQFEEVDRATKASAAAGSLHSQQPGHFMMGRKIWNHVDTQAAKYFHIDPTTPEFVPSQPLPAPHLADATLAKSMQDLNIKAKASVIEDPFSATKHLWERPIGGKSSLSRSLSSNDLDANPTQSGESRSYHEPSPMTSMSWQSFNDHGRRRSLNWEFGAGPDAKSNTGVVTNAQPGFSGARTPTRGSSLRHKTVYIDKTIDEEVDGTDDGQQGGVALPNGSSKASPSMH